MYDGKSKLLSYIQWICVQWEIINWIMLWRSIRETFVWAREKGKQLN